MIMTKREKTKKEEMEQPVDATSIPPPANQQQSGYKNINTIPQIQVYCYTLVNFANPSADSNARF